MNVISHWDGNRCVVKYELQLSQATEQAEGYVQRSGMWHSIVRLNWKICGVERRNKFLLIYLGVSTIAYISDKRCTPNFQALHIIIP